MRVRFAALLVALLTVIGCASVGASSAAAAPENLFGTAVPAVKSDGDTGSVELGVQFRPAVDGTVSGVRFYKGTGNTGGHSGSVWSAAGVRLASGTFTGETASGWQTLTFAAPLAVTAGTTYTASYFAPRGHYAVNNPYAWPRVSGNLTGIKGVYRYGPTSGFPGTVFQTSNYWVDVTFAAGTVASPTTTMSAPPTTAPTTPVDPTGAYPDASNTGVPAGTVLTSAASNTISTPGAVIDAQAFTGTVTINAANVTIKRSKVSAGGFFAVRVQSTGFRFEDSEIDGGPLSDGTSGIWPDNNQAFTVIRANIHHVENGVVPGSGSLIQGSWIHNLLASGQPHYDGVQIDGGVNDVQITHNTIDLHELDKTSAVMTDNLWGPVSNVTVNDNRLLGGAFTVYCDGAFTASPMSVAFTNNRMVPGVWGYGLVRGACTGTVTGNVNDTTGAPVSF